MSGIAEDIAALAPWLEEAVPGLGTVAAISKFDTGQSNPTYLVEGACRKVVLRAQPPGKLLPGAHRVDREYRVMAALAGSGVPVPEALALGGADSPLGRMFVVMAHVEGRIYWDPALPDLSNDARAAIYSEMNRVLAALHAVDPAALGLAEFGRPAQYFERQLATWTAAYHASETQPIPEMGRLIAWLGEAMPTEDEGLSGRLVHGDFRLDNMIFDPDTHAVRAVLDWELSTLGHPMADLAYQCMQWRLPNDGVFKGLGGVDRAALGLPSEAAYVADYSARMGLDGIRHWRFYLAFSFLRLAAIVQGVYARALAGNASNDATARAYGAAVPLLAAMALEEITS